MVYHRRPKPICTQRYRASAADAASPEAEVRELTSSSSSGSRPWSRRAASLPVAPQAQPRIGTIGDAAATAAPRATSLATPRAWRAGPQGCRSLGVVPRVRGRSWRDAGDRPPQAALRLLLKDVD